MQRMSHRQMVQYGTANERGPVEGVDMHEIELALSLLKLQKEVEKEIRLGKEARIGGPFQRRPGEAGWPHVLWHIYLFNWHAWNRRTLSCKERDGMLPL